MEKTAAIVDLEIHFQVGLHLVQSLVEHFGVHDTKKFVQKLPVQALDEAIGLRKPDPCGAVLNALKLQEQLVNIVISAATELATVVAQYRGDSGTVLLIEGQHIVVMTWTTVTAVFEV